MEDYWPTLAWIDEQGDRMCGLVRAWSDINSHSENAAGVAAVAEAVGAELSALDPDVHTVAVPGFQRVDDRGAVEEVALGPALVARSRATSGPRVLLAVHTDTVFPVDGPFQRARMRDAGTLHGPGVVDAKGGIAIILVALEAFERSPWAGTLRWEVLLNPDEECGSPGSLGLLRERAARNDVGLVFEPALADDGTLAGARGGAGVFTLVARGRAAHAGRSFDQGRNAVVALAEAISALDGLNAAAQGFTVNVGRVVGGDAVNQVPDFALCRVNVRIDDRDAGERVTQAIAQIVEQTGRRDGIQAELHGGFHCDPKPLVGGNRFLLDRVVECGRVLGLEIRWHATRGVCDGNKLSAAGLPNVDTLGARGGALHTPEEYALIASFPERARLTALFLMRLAAGEIVMPARAGPRELQKERHDAT